MIGKEDNQEEVSYKVADRRKFNADGSVRDGVTLEPEPVKQEPALAAEPSKAASPQPEQMATADETDELAALAGDDLEGDVDETEIPGAQDPASFVNFLSTLATNAAAAEHTTVEKMRAECCAAGASARMKRMAPPPIASPMRSKPTSMMDFAARFSAAGLGV